MKYWGLFGVVLLMTVGVYGQHVKLDTLQVQYVDFQNKVQNGTLICNVQITSDLKEIFAEYGEITDRDRKSLDKIRKMSGISEERAKEIEKMLKKQ